MLNPIAYRGGGGWDGGGGNSGGSRKNFDWILSQKNLTKYEGFVHFHSNLESLTGFQKPCDMVLGLVLPLGRSLALAISLKARTLQSFHLKSPKFLTSLFGLLDTFWQNFR